MSVGDLSHAAPARHGRLAVVYLAGTGRSGSTLLASILGEVEGFFNAGEVRYLWERGMLQNRLCGCGARFGDCPFWQRALAELFAHHGPVDVEAVQQLQSEVTRIRHLPGLVQELHRSAPSSATRRHLGLLGSLYRAIARASGAAVVVDSSKLPSYGFLLSALPEIDLYVVHLTRDPRAASYSWTSRKEQPDRGLPGLMERQSVTKSALLWDVWNAATPQLFNRARAYCQVRYEDFTEHPGQTVQRILHTLGCDPTLNPLQGDTIELGPNHMVAGNPDRLRHGPTRVRPDRRWLENMRAPDFMRATLLTLPLLKTFGYSATRPASGSAARASVRVQGGPAWRRYTRRLSRHYQWIRRDGLARVVEEDELNPLERVRSAAVRARWRRSHPPNEREAPVPVFLFGLQRSGTNMLARGLEANPALEMHNENDRGAFNRFQLRELAAIQGLVARSGHAFVGFKPLIDSDRAVEILDAFPNGRAIWAYRGYEARTASALAKFGDNNLQVLREIAAGQGQDLWQSRGLSRSSLELIRSFDYDALNAESAAALFWFVRNSLFFELGLDRRPDVLLVSYESLLASPEESMRRVAAFVGMPFEARLHAHISPRSGTLKRQLDIDPRIREHCERLVASLDAAAREGRAAVMA